MLVYTHIFSKLMLFYPPPQFCMDHKSPWALTRIKLGPNVQDSRFCCFAECHSSSAALGQDLGLHSIPILFLFHSVPGSSYLVLVLSPEDGRQNMVATATGICQSIVQRQLSVESIDTSLVDNRILGLYVCLHVCVCVRCVCMIMYDMQVIEETL